MVDDFETLWILDLAVFYNFNFIAFFQIKRAASEIICSIMFNNKFIFNVLDGEGKARTSGTGIVGKTACRWISWRLRPKHDYFVSVIEFTHAKCSKKNLFMTDDVFKFQLAKWTGFLCLDTQISSWFNVC